MAPWFHLGLLFFSGSDFLLYPPCLALPDTVAQWLGHGPVDRQTDIQSQALPLISCMTYSGFLDPSEKLFPHKREDKNRSSLPGRDKEEPRVQEVAER